LCTVRGVAETSAAVFSAELFGTPTFCNGRQLGAVLGLVPVPYRSDQRVQDQGISRAGRADLRRIALQLAWCWVRWQPDSALTGVSRHVVPRIACSPALSPLRVRAVSFIPAAGCGLIATPPDCILQPSSEQPATGLSRLLVGQTDVLEGHEASICRDAIT
jgi:hypothetical protein